MDANVMDTQKKAYNTPELGEYGSLCDITQNNCGTNYTDWYDGTPNYGDSTTNVCW